jgi:predicted Zn-dependent peptidase
VYAGCSKKRVPEVLRLIRAELDRVAADGITADEVARSRGQLKGGLVLGLEDTGSRMSRLGKSELVYGELMTVDELLGHIDAVTVDDVQMLAFELLRGPTALAVIGPYDDDRVLAAGVA